jgi:type II secretory pathway pseudopilin PulG
MKNIFKITKQKGTTLVELILYMGILTVLLVILTSVFTSALDVQSESEAVSSVEQDGNYILARLGYDIHRAQSILVPNAIGVTNNNLQILVNGISYTYSVNGNNLVLANDLGSNNLNSFGSGVSAFSVQRLGNAGKVEDTVKITFTITSTTKRISGFEIKNFETNFSLRRQ